MNGSNIAIILVLASAGNSYALQSSPVPPAESLSSELARIRKEQAPSFERSLQEEQLLYYLGQQTDGKDQKKKMYEEGLKLAEQSRNQKPDDPDAILWWTAHEGSLAEINKGASGLNAVTKIEAALLTLKKTHPEYGHAAADRVLGRLYQKAPSFISVGSSRRAEEHLRGALAKFPTYPGNQVFLADFLAEEGKKEEASRLALAALRSPELQSYPRDAHDWKQMAMSVLQRTGVEVPKELTN